MIAANWMNERVDERMFTVHWMIFKVWVLRAHVRRPSHPADFVMEQEWLIRHHIDALLLSKKSQKPKSPLWSIWRTPNAGTKFLLADLLVNLNTIWYRWVCEIFQVDFYSKVDSQLKRIFLKILLKVNFNDLSLTIGYEI